MEKQIRRVQWIDIIKYICMMWVMLSHLESNTNILRSFYSPFYLFGFFFASGYVYCHKQGFKLFLKKKIKGLLVPWLVFSVFNILLSQIITFNKHSTLTEELMWNFFQIRGKSDGVWFVAALFVAFIPFYFFIALYEKGKKGPKDNIIFIGIVLLLSIISNIYCKYMNPSLLPWGTNSLPWHLEYIFIAIFWMSLGYLFKQYEGLYDTRVKVTYVIAIGLIYLVIRYLPYIIGYDFENSVFDILYSYVSSFLGMFILIYVSKRIPYNRYLLYIGQNTLICFAIHGKVYSLMQEIAKRFAGKVYNSIITNTLAASVFAIIFTLALSIILIIPIYIINRWFPFLVGRRYKKREGTKTSVERS